MPQPVAQPALPAPAPAAEVTDARAYPWLEGRTSSDRISTRFAPPAGFERVAQAPGSFGAWLRDLPLEPGRPPVHLFDGREKADATVHAAVLDIDVGRRDLQQCADAVIRLRAEWQRAAGRAAEIRFRFTSGDMAEYAEWARGGRPEVRGNRVTWSRTAAPDDSRASFRAYLDCVFTYAGTASLSRELRVASADVLLGDVFVRGGSPGHAVIVVDVARSRPTGRTVFLLVQSYMPAQDVHVLRNPGSAALDPWYDASFGAKLVTPEWTFVAGERRRF